MAFSIPQKAGRVTRQLGQSLLLQTRAAALRLRWPGAWIGIGVLIGLAPFPLALLIGWPLSVFLAALALSIVLLMAAASDAPARGLGAVAAAFFSHCAIAILISYHAPWLVDTHYPEGQDYWARSRHWILTGVNAEYDTSHWLPVHGVLLLLVASSAYVSFGVVTFYLGFMQVNLMNAYVGQLLAQSDSPWIALGLGWHPWSVLRGLGYLVLTYEAASVSLAHMAGAPISAPERRRSRWFLVLFFVAADALVKYFGLEPCRQALLSNWRE